MENGYIRKNVCLDSESVSQLEKVLERRKESGFYSKSACSYSTVVREAIRMLYMFECEHSNIIHPGHADN